MIAKAQTDSACAFFLCSSRNLFPVTELVEVTFLGIMLLRRFDGLSDRGDKIFVAM